MKPQQSTLSAANYIFLWEHLYIVDKVQALVYDILHPTTIQLWLRHRSPITVIQQTVFRWCSNCSKFLTDNSNCITRFFHNRPYCLRHHKYNQNHLNRDGLFFSVFFFFFLIRGARASRFTCVLRHHALSTVPKPFGGRWERQCMDRYAEIKSAPLVA